MKRHFILASHSMLAAGMADTVRFFAGEGVEIKTLTAYLDNKPIDEQVKLLVEEVPDEDELVVCTDIMAGSVNQKFIPYLKRPHFHLISGMNLPLLAALSLEPSDSYLTREHIEEVMEDARKQLVYVNTVCVEEDEEDE